MIPCFFGNHSILADCIITSIVPKVLRQLTFPQTLGGIMVCKFSWLQSRPSPFLSGRKAHSQQLSLDARLKGTWTSTLSAFSFQRCNPRMGAACLFWTPPPHRPAPRDAVRTTAPGACALELVPSPFGNHVISPFSVLVSYFFFEVYCLPKITSPRLGDRGGIAADSDRVQILNVRLAQ